MTVSSISSALAASLASSSSSNSSSTSSTLSTDDFLQLLVTQLENQNPLDPENTTDFMNQLVSYASYSQQESTNNSMSQLVSSMNSLLASNGIGYIGQTIEAKGDTTTLQDGQATWGYSLTSDAQNVSISVQDQDGNTVWTGSGETSEGSHTFTWDGTTSSGSTAPDGDYTISVSATNSDGTSVLDYTSVIGTVTGVDSSSGTPQLIVGDTTVDLSNVINIQ
jgi:flagellar basal-body rod modification protein FlgD